MADSKTPKNDQLRAMREENAKRSVIRQKQASWPPAPISLAPVEARVAKAKAVAVANTKAANKRKRKEKAS